MEIEIIKTDNPNVIIERSFFDKEINIAELANKKADSILLIQRYNEENNNLNSLLTGNKIVDDLIYEKINSNNILIDGFNMDIAECDRLL